MSTTTPNLGLFKYNTTEDANTPFSINTALNNNWDIIDENVGNIDDKITNCITEIPQDIKLELNNGTLTLKAGSKVYVPNGFESDGTTPKFNEIITQQDISGTYADGNYYCFYTKDYGTGSGVNEVTSTVSGTTDTGTGWHLWYDTTNNVIRRYNGSTIVEDNCSLPICIYSSSSSSITGIDQIFNGFGYIGSTGFVLPGVKGLIPAGRNDDGSLKNREIVISSVIIRIWTYQSDNQPLFLTTTSMPNSGTYYVSTIEPTSPSVEWVMWYNPEENLMKYSSNTGSWTIYYDWLYLGCVTSSASASENYKLTKFSQPKNVVQLVTEDWIKERSKEVQCVIETYQNGTSWYRVYSDGWCEQGGISSSAGDQTSNTIWLLKGYKDTNYSILFAQNAGVEGSYTNGCTAKNKTTSSFVLVYRTGGTASFYWQSCGYIR